jgi:BarA-like signal transduction histidine kinase
MKIGLEIAVTVTENLVTENLVTENLVTENLVTENLVTVLFSHGAINHDSLKSPLRAIYKPLTVLCN